MSSEVQLVIPENTEVTILSQYGPWLEVEWQTAAGLERGWVPSSWVRLAGSIPDELVTPYPGQG